MAIPLVPVLKLLALGSIKIILLGVGALFFPVLTVRLIVGGTGESVKLAANWMQQHDKLSAAETEQFLQLLQKVQDAELEKSQARGLIMAMIGKTFSSMGNSIRNMLSWITGLFRQR